MNQKKISRISQAAATTVNFKINLKFKENNLKLMWIILICRIIPTAKHVTTCDIAVNISDNKSTFKKAIFL